MFSSTSSGKRWLYINTSPGPVFFRLFSQLTHVKKYAIFISQVPSGNLQDPGNFLRFEVSSRAGRGFSPVSPLPPVHSRHFVPAHM